VSDPGRPVWKAGEAGCGARQRWAATSSRIQALVKVGVEDGSNHG